VAEVDLARLELPTELLGPRVRLRPYREDDAKALWEAIDESRASLGRWLPWVEDYRSPADAAPSVRRLEAQWLTRENLAYAVFDRRSERMLGGAGLVRNDLRVPRFEIGYWLRDSAVGHGYVTECVQVLTRFCFDDLRAQRVEIRMDPRNARSRAVPERLGFVHEGCLRNRAPDVDGQPADMDVFALVPDDFKRLGWAALS
jgi:RimJ/RimL family protein N-acetyltransferase